MGRSRFAGFLAFALWCAGALLALRACALADGFGARQMPLAGAAIATGIVALLAWRRAPCGELRWDGAEWRWHGATEDRAGALSVALDLQQRLLVRFRAADGTALWLWLDSIRAGGGWHALRCAAHARVAAPRES